MFIVEVIPITKSIRTPSLTYFSTKEVSLGSLVTVPLRKQEVLAVVSDTRRVLDMKMMLKNASFQLRNILTIHDTQLFDEAFLSMATEIARYHASHSGLVLDTLLPKAITKDINAFVRAKKITEKKNVHEVLLLQKSEGERMAYYKTRARELLANKQSLFIACPNSYQAEYVYKHLSHGIEKYCSLLHGSLSTKKVKQIYKTIQESDTPVVIIGTPQYMALAPDSCEEFIIESSSNAYESMTSPFIDMKLAIERYAYYRHVRCVYADTFIGIDLWHRQQQQEVTILEPSSKRILDPKRLSVVSFAQGEETEKERLKTLLHTQKGFHPLHHTMMEQLKEEVAKKHKVFLFVPKKGLAPNMVCGDCGKIAVSPISNTPYSMYVQQNKETGAKEHIYISNKTGEKIPAFDLCQYCKGFNLKKMGIGTAQLASLLSEAFPKVPIITIDGTSVTTKKALGEIHKVYEKEGPCFVVGTSKVLTTLEEWDTALIVTLAPLYSRMSYRNEEEVLQLVSHIQDRTKGMVFVQERNEANANLEIFSNGMALPFVAKQLEERGLFHYPPRFTLIHLSIIISKKVAKQQFMLWEKELKAFDPSILLRPHSTTNVRLIILIKLPLRDWSIRSQVEPLRSLLEVQGRNVTLKINPPSIE